MICRVGDVVYRGPAVSLSREVPPRAIVEAIEADGDHDRNQLITVECPPPRPVHEHVGDIHPEMGLRTRTALAKAGRTRGLETPHDDELAAAREELESLSAVNPEPTLDREAAASKEASARTELHSLQEDVSAARGRLRAYRDRDLETSEAENELEAAVRKLSEHETTAAAAREEHERARMDARERRDRLERTFRLGDRVANLERNARRSLVDQLREEFATAVERVPDADPPADPFAAPPPVAALAVARLASLDAPVVLRTGRFDSVTAAYEFIGTPVIQV